MKAARSAFGVDFAARLVNLDTMKLGPYKPRPLALLLGTLLVPAMAQAAAPKAHGLVLPGGAQEVGENRFRSSESYEETLKYFDKAYRGSPRKVIVNQPGIRAVHFESADPRSAYEGFNVYEKDKEVRIFVIPREDVAAAKKPSSTSKKGSR